MTSTDQTHGPLPVLVSSHTLSVGADSRSIILTLNSPVPLRENISHVPAFRAAISLNDLKKLRETIDKLVSTLDSVQAQPGARN